jgi:hypothetical protein
MVPVCAAEIYHEASGQGATAYGVPHHMEVAKASSHQGTASKRTAKMIMLAVHIT